MIFSHYSLRSLYTYLIGFFWNNGKNIFDITHAIPNKHIVISILNILVVPGQRSVDNMVLQNGFDCFERVSSRKGKQQ